LPLKVHDTVLFLMCQSRIEHEHRSSTQVPLLTMSTFGHPYFLQCFIIVQSLSVIVRDEMFLPAPFTFQLSPLSLERNEWDKPGKNQAICFVSIMGCHLS